MKTTLPWPMRFAAVVGTALGCAGLVLTRVVDPDVFWHVRTGQWIVAHRALPATDPFLQTQGETPWELHEWLFEVLMVPLHDWWGLGGLRVLGAAAIVIMFVSLYRIGRRGLGEFAAALSAVAIIGIAVSGFVARPQIASYCLFVPLLGSVVHHYDSGRWQPLVWIPPGMVLWTNLHGGYMIALGVLLVAAVAAWIDWSLIPKARGQRPQRSLAPLVACCVASLLATAVNPYGFEHLLYPFRTMSIWLLPLIAEWKPLAWDSPHERLVFILIFAFVLFQQYRKQPSPVFDWAVPFALVFLALQSLRHAPFAALAIGVMLMSRWHLRPDWLASTSVVLAHLRRATGRPVAVAPSPRKELSRTAEGLLNTALIVTMLVVAVTVAIAFPTGVLASQRTAAALKCGIDAIDYVRRHAIAGPGLNEYAFGGYMTYALWPGQKAFIDGRSDMYPDAFAKEYMTMTNGAPGWRDIFERHGFNYVVMPRATPLVHLLLARGTFEITYEDSKNVVLVRKPVARHDDEQGGIRPVR